MEIGVLRGYLRYDMHTMRGVGKRMDVATGLCGFTKLKPKPPKNGSFQTGGKKKVAQPQ